MICNMLPVPDGKFLISQAIDIVNSVPWDTSFANQMFKTKLIYLPIFNYNQVQELCISTIPLLNTEYAMVL